jgi:CRP-like cAMP-binding protein
MRGDAEALRTSMELIGALIGRLSGLELFRGVSREALATLAQEIEWLGLPSGCQLFAQGDRADGLYVVLTGRLGVYLTEPDGHQRLVNEVVTGDAVGDGTSLGRAALRQRGGAAGQRALAAPA